MTKEELEKVVERLDAIQKELEQGKDKEDEREYDMAIQRLSMASVWLGGIIRKK